MVNISQKFWSRPGGVRAGLFAIILAMSLGFTVVAEAESKSGNNESAPKVDDPIFGETIAQMTYLEYEEAVKNGAVAIWSLGVIEEHGPHMPLGTDAYRPSATLREMHTILNEAGVSNLLIPTYYWGINNVTRSFPGSIHVRPEIMVELMEDVFKSLERDGLEYVFCISGHGDMDHIRAIYEGVQQGARETSLNIFMVVHPISAGRLGADEDSPNLIITETGRMPPPKKYHDIHAGAGETSMMWAHYPHLIRKDLVSGLEPTKVDDEGLAEWRKGGEHAKKITPDGYLGDPAAADPERGRQIVSGRARLFADAIRKTVQSE